MYMSQDQDDDATATNGSITPVNVNNDLPRTYPVSRDPSLVNRDCEVESAVYREATGTCKDSDGNVLTGEEGRCGVGTAVKTLVTSGPGASTGFVPASGTGTCSLLESSGPCEVPCAQDCVGGEWVLGETCVRLDKDGNEIVLYDGGKLEDGTCGPGQYTDVRNTSEATGFIPPKGRFGACQYTRTRPCNKTCVDENGNAVDAEFVGFCGYSGIVETNRSIGLQMVGHYGCVKKDAYDRPVKDQNGEYVDVGIGEQGVQQRYKEAVYGDTTMCENQVWWEACEGPPPKTDCEGDWIIQRPDAESDKEWSVCKLKDGQKWGRTWRQKEYQITTPQGELTRDGVTIPWGEPCMADVVIDGVMNTLEMKPKEKGGQLVFAELCSKAQSVEECDKGQWELDRKRGQNCDMYGENCDGCALDDDDEPVKKYTRTVEGACAAEDGTPYAEYDDDGTGNATEDSVGCCYKTEWVDDDVAVNQSNAGEQPQTRVVKNCTENEDDGDPDGIATERTRPVCYVPEWTDNHKVGKCGEHWRGNQKYEREVKNASLCTGNADTTKWVPCCDQTEWEQGATCQSDGHYKETRSVSNACKDLEDEDAAETRQGDKCCYINKSGGKEPLGACGSNGLQTFAWKDTKNCEDDEKNAGVDNCCYASDDQWGAWQKQGTCKPGQLDIEVKRTREVVNRNLCTDDPAIEQTDRVHCDRPSCDYFGTSAQFEQKYSENYHPVINRTHQGQKSPLPTVRATFSKSGDEYGCGPNKGVMYCDKETKNKYLDECAQMCNDADGCEGFSFKMGGSLVCEFYGANEIYTTRYSSRGGSCWNKEVRNYWRKKNNSSGVTKEKLETPDVVNPDYKWGFVPGESKGYGRKCTSENSWESTMTLGPGHGLTTNPYLDLYDEDECP